MKKIIAVAAIVVLCMAVALPVAAYANGFVPSITYKGGPEVEEALLLEDKAPAYGEDGNVHGCVVVTSIEQANEKATDITQEERDLLLEVYQQLNDGTMTLPIEGDYVIRDLVDVSFKHMECRSQQEHGDKPGILKEEKTTLTMDFDMGIEQGTDLVVMTYIDGVWEDIVSVEINEDGSVTCVFEDACPVAFVVKG